MTEPTRPAPAPENSADQQTRIARLALTPGDIVWRWWDAGCSMDVQPLQVVRVNRLTVTVRTEQGNEFRAPHEQVNGRYTEGDARFPA